mmetsp:Transcript_8921/g.17821  ORF Transcript_8921/g.17821 Transcript_8921/m.17821 type:complete len:201 (-) Transcript_8921:672-1274(-)
MPGRGGKYASLRSPLGVAGVPFQSHSLGGAWLVHISDACLLRRAQALCSWCDCEMSNSSGTGEHAWAYAHASHLSDRSLRTHWWRCHHGARGHWQMLRGVQEKILAFRNKLLVVELDDVSFLIGGGPNEHGPVEGLVQIEELVTLMHFAVRINDPPERHLHILIKFAGPKNDAKDDLMQVAVLHKLTRFWLHKDLLENGE